ncbi:glycine--tRNA ligase 1, mitochondrial-like [Dorcoceras hygrometricum]|uniref:Glycine--tRNA ligase 1, mitochondrial-like n=1 Tax=Dorcoceras hygrometricum TaxID=472368 RepID=A0A2Z7DA63_9LAMI|nr:glycine--tRNA ligase 1, mitochondrial-like [Dorcoceras hygrometricum]
MASSVPRTRAAAALRMKQIALDNQSHMIRRLRAKRSTERRESAAIKKEHEGLQEDNGAPAPFDDEWEEDSEEEGLEDIPLGEGEIVEE